MAHFRNFRHQATLQADPADSEDLDPIAKLQAEKLMSLAVLFGGQKQPLSRLLPEEIDAESVLMEALAELEEDGRLDNGAVEINSDKEFQA